MARKPKDPHRFSYEGRLTWLTLAAVVPAIVVALALLWFGDYSAKVQWTLTILIVGCFLVFVSSAREQTIRPLQTMSNLLAALREGDYSIRARGARGGNALGEVLLEINSLGETLRLQRLGAFEATALLRTIMSEIDVAVFTFDPKRRLRLVNRAGETLLGQPMDKLLGKTADELALNRCLEANEDEPLTLNFAGASGRWGVRRSTFREEGLPHELLVLTDLSRTLREEERRAWQRIVRVLGHEMNNSLAPIKSLAASLESLMRRDPLPPDWKDDASCRFALYRLPGRFAQPFSASLHAADQASAASKTTCRSRRAGSARRGLGTEAQCKGHARSENSDSCRRSAD